MGDQILNLLLFLTLYGGCVAVTAVYVYWKNVGDFMFAGELFDLNWPARYSYRCKDCGEEFAARSRPPKPPLCSSCLA